MLYLSHTTAPVSNNYKLMHKGNRCIPIIIIVTIIIKYDIIQIQAKWTLHIDILKWWNKAISNWKISCLEVSKEKNMIPAIILLPTAIVEEFSVDNNV